MRLILPDVDYVLMLKELEIRIKHSMIKIEDNANREIVFHHKVSNQKPWYKKDVEKLLIWINKKLYVFLGCEQ